MVSLGDENRHHGGFFFGQEHSLTGSQGTDDTFNETTVLTADVEPHKLRIRTIKYIVVEILLLISLETALFVVPHCCPGSRCGISAFSLLVYARASIWFLAMLVDRCFRYHHAVSRRNGYLEFYRQTKNIRRVPFVVLSGGNAALLIVLILLQTYCHTNNGDDEPCSSLDLKRNNFLQIIVSVEVVIVLIACIVYLVNCVKFNLIHAPPDVAQDEMLNSFLQSQTPDADIGFRDEDYLDEVLEKQADMIRYLKQHNAHLGKKLLQLTQQLNIAKQRTG